MMALIFPPSFPLTYSVMSASYLIRTSYATTGALGQSDRLPWPGGAMQDLVYELPRRRPISGRSADEFPFIGLRGSSQQQATPSNRRNQPYDRCALTSRACTLPPSCVTRRGTHPIFPAALEEEGVLAPCGDGNDTRSGCPRATAWIPPTRLSEY
jgi:hypothetical protein